MDQKAESLARKLGHEMEGHVFGDIISVCAMFAAYAIRENYATAQEREKVLDGIVKFMTSIVTKGSSDGGVS